MLPLRRLGATGPDAACTTCPAIEARVVLLASASICVLGPAQTTSAVDAAASTPPDATTPSRPAAVASTSSPRAATSTSSPWAPPEAGTQEAGPDSRLRLGELVAPGRRRRPRGPVAEVERVPVPVLGRCGWGGRRVRREEPRHLLLLGCGDAVGALRLRLARVRSARRHSAAGTRMAASTTSSTTAQGKQQHTATHSAAIPPTIATPSGKGKPEVRIRSPARSVSSPPDATTPSRPPDAGELVDVARSKERNAGHVLCFFRLSGSNS